MDSQEQQQAQTASVSNPYLLRLQCFLCHAFNPNVNDENNNLKKANSNTNENSFNPISKLPLYTCPDCEAKIRLEEKESNNNNSSVTSEDHQRESERMIIVPETSSDEDDEDEDEECWCPSCLALINDEHDSKYRELWDHLSHVIKCLYRAADKDFSENHLSDDVSKAKEYVKKLTKINAQSLFNKLETIVSEYVLEIRKQVLERFHTCSKTSHDVQLFISFLLDEYQMFIQAANYVSTVLSYFEEHYLKSFHLTWLLYNKHLYEELIYMNRKIHHSISTMIDLLQPALSENNNEENYSPAEYTQLLNRFLTFDKEMSEIACLYKDSQTKMISKLSDSSGMKHFHSSILKSKSRKTKQCKKLRRSKPSSINIDDNSTSSTTTAVDIPLSSSGTTAAAAAASTIEQGSNCSSVGSGTAGDEYSSMSSIDDQLLDNETSSSGYTQEEQEELTRLIFDDDDMNEYLLQEILNSVTPYGRLQHQMSQSKLDEQHRQNDMPDIELVDDEWIRQVILGEIKRPQLSQEPINNWNPLANTSPDEATNVSASSGSTTKKSSSSKSKSNKSSSRRRKDFSMLLNPTATAAAAAAATTAPTTTSTSQIPKKSIAPDLLFPRPFADLSAKFESVSFTAGTFGSITSNDSLLPPSISSPSSSSNCSTTTLTAAKTTTATGQTRLSISLARKPGSSKPIEHGGQKIAEALFNELTGLGNGESSTRENSASTRKKENQPFKKNKQQRPTTTNTNASNNETLSSPTNSNSSNSHCLFGSSNKSEATSSSTAFNNLDQILRHAASNADVSEAALHSILSSFHPSTCVDSSSSSSSNKHSISAKTTEALQALIAQQQQQHLHHHHHHHQQKKKTLLNNHKRCEFCCCDFAEGRTCSPSTCLNLPTASNTSNGTISSCVTCMSLPGATTNTTSVMGTTITGPFNQRDIEMKERLKLKLTKRTVQNLAEQQSPSKDPPPKEQKQPTKKASTPVTKPTEKKPNKEVNSKTREFVITDKNNIDDLVRFIDGDQSVSLNPHEHHSTTTAANQESTSKKNKKKKDKQAKANHNNQQENNNTSASVKDPQKSTTNGSHEKQNETNGVQQSAPSEKSPPNIVSPSTTKKNTSIPSTASNDQSQQSVSKKKQKAKLKQQQEQQKQKETSHDVEEESVRSRSMTTTAAVTSTTPVTQSKVEHHLPSETFDSPAEEEEINWITISRKQSKHKPTPPSVPSLLATPVLPVVPLQTTKQQRQHHPPSSTTTTTSTAVNTKKTSVVPSASPLAQQKVIPSTISTSNLTNHKQPPPTTTLPVRSQNVLQNYPTQKIEPSMIQQPPVNLWKTNSIPDTVSVTPSVTSSPVFSTSTLLPTASSYVPTHTLSTVTPPPSSMLTEDLSLSMGWDPTSYLLPPPPVSMPPTLLSSAAPGPVQRPHVSFSPAPGPINNTASRCIQRPSPEPRPPSVTNTSFPLYFPMNYSGINSNPGWSDPAVTTSHESQWKYPQEEPSQFGLPTTSNDFPLYDPFHSGAGLSIPSSSSSTQTALLTNGFSEHFIDLYAVPQDNDINDMDALDKEIEDFKKFCFEHVPLETREKVQVNADRCFVRQA